MMKVCKGLKEIDLKDPIVLTIGNFDGVHLGHQDLVRQLKNHAKKFNAKTAVMTFSPHPMFILNQVSDKFLLSNQEEKHELLARLGIDYLVEIPFTRDLSTLSPEDFLNNYVFVHEQLKGLVLGFNFSFGAKKAGTHDVVRSIAATNTRVVEVTVAKAFDLDGVTLASSKIRQELEAGRIEIANKFLGRQYNLSGVVVRGDGIGRTIGFPTANIKILKERCFPRAGVYVTKTECRKKEYFSLTNIGYRPTFVNESILKFETHILDFDETIYGEEISVSFYSQIRCEKKFASVAELIDQINRDKNFAIDFWKKSKL
jgi:riboflavin kinase/FMN adenylyltransferase